MRLMFFALAACVLALAACSSGGTPSGPRGWKTSGNSGWVNPADTRETFLVSSASFDGTLKDLASQTTTDIILRRQVKYRGGVPFSRCPGEAGLQTFESAKPPATVVEAAFSVQNNKRILAEYIRPASERDDPAAIDALAANVCVVP